MLKRPNYVETDQDILRLQREFKDSNTKPSVNLIKDSEEAAQEDDDEQTNNLKEHIANTFEAIPKNANIGNVVEKTNPEPGLQMCFKLSKSGFPQAKRRNITVSASKGSIFSNHIKKVRMDVDVPDLVVRENVESKQQLHDNLPDQSYVLSGKDKDVIHQENVKLLRRMNEEDIVKERNELLENVDPAIIAFLKDRRNIRQDPVVARPSIAEQNKASNINVEDLATTSDILKRPEAENWLNFDVVETSKLAWMKDLKLTKIKKDSKFEARFDFEGWLLPYLETDINEKNRILYHHGEEPERPGYTLQELFQLSRSSVIQQKVVALNTIANILSLQSTGIYEEIIELPIEQIFFVLRFCVDDNTPSVLNASLKALMHLFCNYIDEMCLDNLNGFGLGIVQPVLAVNIDDHEDNETVNDQQLAETDLVKCLIRTNILSRIRYIINTIQPSAEMAIYCLELLIRLSRDSNYVLLEILKCTNLISCVVKNFVPPLIGASLKSNYEQTFEKAVKLVRVISARGKKFATQMVEKYNIMHSVSTYLSNELLPTNSCGLKLQIEAMHLWVTFLRYNLTTEYLSTLEPVLLRMLHYHISNTNADASLILQAHAGACLNLVGGAIRIDAKIAQPYLQMLTSIAAPKWTLQFSSLQDHTCGKLQILSSLLNCVSELREQSGQIEGHVLSLVTSNSFESVTDNLSKYSNILSGFETNKSSPNLVCAEAATWNSAEHIVPILQTRSSLPFLHNLSKFVRNCNNSTLKLAFLNSKNIALYLNLICDPTTKLGMTSNWFTRIESQFLINVLHISAQIRAQIELKLYFDLAVKCMSLFTVEQKADIKFVLENIVFNRDFYPAECLLGHLSLQTEDEENLATITNHLPDIVNVYKHVLGLKQGTRELQFTLSLDVKTGNVIPVDWIYSPIILLYSNQEKDKSIMVEESQVFVIVNCLRWLYIYEMYFPHLSALIKSTDCFCRLACIFLANDSLFLNNDVQRLLSMCLKNLLKREKDINFDDRIQGLTNFQDFYIQLLEQYQGVSYGNSLFGNFLLVPLTQHQNVKWKKILYSEYAGVVQIFNVPKDQAYLNYELFVDPPEIDASLIKCYGRILQSGSIRRHSILYDVLSYHVKHWNSKSTAK